MWSVNSGEVVAPANVIAEVGHPLVLGCNITTETGDTVRQVRWLNRRSEILLAYEQSAPVRVSHQEPGVRLTASHNDASYITIKRVQLDDEGCYLCIFDVFPNGPQEGKTCVTVTGQSELRISPKNYFHRQRDCSLFCATTSFICSYLDH